MKLRKTKWNLCHLHHQVVTIMVDSKIYHSGYVLVKEIKVKKKIAIKPHFMGREPLKIRRKHQAWTFKKHPVYWDLDIRLLQRFNLILHQSDNKKLQIILIFQGQIWVPIGMWFHNKLPMCTSINFSKTNNNNRVLNP